MSHHPDNKYSGLTPQKGWPHRNAKFLRHRLVPGIFSKINGSSLEPILTPPSDGSVRITWIGHSSFFLQFPQNSLLIDPNWARWHGPIKRQRSPGLRLKAIPPVDLILVTHAHFDHLHKPSLKILQSTSGIVVPTGSADLVHKLGFSEIHEMKTWDTLHLSGLEITHTPAHHWGARYVHDTHRHYGGYLVTASGKTIFHCGDSTYFEGFSEIGKRHPIDIALMPIGAYDSPSGRDVHMNPEQALRAFTDLGAKTLIPMHYGTFHLGNEAIDEPLQRLLAEAHRLGISEKILIPETGIPIEY